MCRLKMARYLGAVGFGRILTLENAVLWLHVMWSMLESGVVEVWASNPAHSAIEVSHVLNVKS